MVGKLVSKRFSFFGRPLEWVRSVFCDNGTILKYLMRRTWHLPDQVPSGQREFLEARGYIRWKWIVKFIKRRLFCFLFVQQFGLTLEHKTISDKHRRILWINWSAPSLGDSLMDLSARVLLLGHEVTLLTHPKNADLYKNDPLFSAVYSELSELIRCLGRGYFDLVICDAFSPRVFVRKLLVAPRTPFVGLYSYVNGFEVHRTYFAFARMRELLSIDCAISEVRPTIALPDCSSKAPAADVCVAVGGEWSFRSYDHWLPVVQWLVDRGLSVTLVGSENGEEEAEFISSSVPSVHSTVGQLSLPEVVGQIASCKVFIGADGGLWHIACSIPVPTVVLFADCQIFDEAGNRVTRETTDMVCETLYNDAEVSKISPHSVTEACERLFIRICM